MHTSIALLDTEIVRLDGCGRVEVQREVDRARERLALVARIPDMPANLAQLVALICEEARTHGRLTYRYESIRHCRTCGRDAGYAKHTRSGRYHRKGQANHDKPLSFAAHEFAVRFISMDRHVSVGACDVCIETIKPALLAELADIRAEVPEAFSGTKPRWRYYENAECTACGWKGHEGEMRRLYAVFGGTYPGGCPKCPAENKPLGETIVKRGDGFTVVAAGTP